MWQVSSVILSIFANFIAYYFKKLFAFVNDEYLFGVYMECSKKMATEQFCREHSVVERSLYNPFQHRDVEHPTTDFETLVHLVKGSLGSGILAMPLAFQSGGLWFSLFATILIGFITTYCTHVFVKCGHIICQKRQIPCVGFKQTAELAFLDGPQSLQRFSRAAGIVVDAALISELLGCCCAYVILVSRNLKQVVEYYAGEEYDLRLYMFALLFPLILLNLDRSLKHLTPLSMISNVLFVIGIVITFCYILVDLPQTNTRPSFPSWGKLPSFFGTTIFALEGIGVVMPLENNMRNPQHFLGCPGVLNIGMFIIILLYTVTGFLGYLKYGEDVKANITLNLPTDKLMGQALKIMVSTAVFFSYSLLFYLALALIFGSTHKDVRNKCTKNLYRILFVIGTVIVAALFPNLGPFLTLVGALSLSLVGLIIPPILEMLVSYSSPGMGRFYWRFWKNLAILLFGFTGLVTGTMVALKEMIETFDLVGD